MRLRLDPAAPELHQEFREQRGPLWTSQLNGRVSLTLSGLWSLCESFVNHSRSVLTLFSFVFFLPVVRNRVNLGTKLSWVTLLQHPIKTPSANAFGDNPKWSKSPICDTLCCTTEQGEGCKNKLNSVSECLMLLVKNWTYHCSDFNLLFVSVR